MRTDRRLSPGPLQRPLQIARAPLWRLESVLHIAMGGGTSWGRGTPSASVPLEQLSKRHCVGSLVHVSTASGTPACCTPVRWLPRWCPVQCVAYWSYHALCSPTGEHRARVAPTHWRYLMGDLTTPPLPLSSFCDFACLGLCVVPLPLPACPGFSCTCIAVRICWGRGPLLQSPS